MTPNEIKQVLADLSLAAREACETAKVARKHSKSLAGDNFYGNKFHSQTVTMASLEGKLVKVLEQEATAEGWAALHAAASVLRSTDAAPAHRAASLRDLTTACEVSILPAVERMGANPIPAFEHVLPMSVVRGTRGYVERVVQQANGCYEHQWYEACSVMIRRLVEMLIIAVYEADNRAQDIKDPRSGEFFMLSGLVDILLNDSSVNLGRETRKSLPLIKSLGDRGAHTRFYMARKEDVDKVLHDLRVLVDELLIRSMLRK